MSRSHGIRIAVISAFIIGIAAIAGLLVAPPVAAHQRVTVGTFELTVGWRVEPAIVGVLNGLDLGIEDNSSGTPTLVVGVENNLTATLTTGPATKTYALSPQDERPGWYTFDIIPTVAGAYSVHLVGTLNTTAVNVNVPLDAVAQAANYQWPPSTEPTPTDLQNSITALTAQLASLQTLLTVLVAVAVLAVLIGAASLAFTVRTARSMRRSP